jgi:hypothetical protein
MKDWIIGILKAIVFVALVIGLLIGFIYVIEHDREETKKNCEENGGVWVQGVNYTKDYCIYKEKE